MSELTIKRKLFPVYLGIATAVSVIAIAVRAIVNGISSGYLGIGDLFYFGFVFLFGLWLSYHRLKEVFTKEPALRISNEGIVDKVSYARPGLLPWDNIKGARVEMVKLGFIRPASEHLVIELVETKEIMQRVSKARKLAVSRLTKKTGSPIALNAGWIDYDINKLATQINQTVQRRSDTT